MAQAHGTRHHPEREPRRHGQDDLAEVVPIRPAGAGQGNKVFRIVQVFASLRAQAAPVGSPPKPPTSPAPLRSAPHAPDAA